jgi:hypothetical protein
MAGSVYRLAGAGRGATTYNTPQLREPRRYIGVSNLKLLHCHYSFSKCVSSPDKRKPSWCSLYRWRERRAIRHCTACQRLRSFPQGPERDAAIAYGKTPAGRRAKCVLDIQALEANIPVRVPFWMFGGRGFPNGGESWPDWFRVAAYWLHPDGTVSPAWD